MVDTCTLKSEIRIPKSKFLLLRPRPMIPIDFSGIDLRLKHEAGKVFVFDPVRRKWLVLTPEEQVRQYLLAHLTGTMQYPQSLIAVEKKIMVGAMHKRFDIVVYDRTHNPWMLVECKAPEIPI